MRIFPIAIVVAVLAASPGIAKPPREESPAPRDVLEAFGAGSSDEELARQVAAAEAFPLGTLQNPIRTEGPEGARAYLVRLRCGDGSVPVVGVEKTGGVGAYGSVTGLFPVDCRAAAPAKTELAFDFYHEGHVENRAPAGFRLLP
jgi:hypothetical protein